MVIGQDCDLSCVCGAPTSDQTCSLYVTHLQVLSPEEQTLAANNDYNFDHPGAFDFELLVTTLRKLKQGKSVKIPVYDFTTHGRQKDWVSVCRRCFTIFSRYHQYRYRKKISVVWWCLLFHPSSRKMSMVPASLSLKASCPLQTKSSCRYYEMFRFLYL